MREPDCVAISLPLRVASGDKGPCGLLLVPFSNVGDLVLTSFHAEKKLQSSAFDSAGGSLGLAGEYLLDGEQDASSC